MALAATETLHGIARTVWFNHRLGKARATQISVFTGTALAFVVCYMLVPGIGLTGAPQHLMLGAMLAAFMAGFDIALGRWVMRLDWERILRDFNPFSGNFLSLGLAALVAMPALVWWLQQ